MSDASPAAAIHAAWRWPEGSTPILELTRSLRHPPSAIWPALVDPQRLCAWLGVEWLGEPGELKVGSRYDYRFGDTGMESRGQVIRIEPGRLIEHSWFENVPPASVVSWALEPEGAGSRLTLTHGFGVPDDGPRTAAGWTMILGSLARHLGEADPPAALSGMEAWRAARDRYAASFPAAALRDGRRIEVDGHPALRFERLIAHPPQAVWDALVSPEAIVRWLQAAASVEPRAGGRIQLHFQSADHATIGEILVFEPPRRLDYTWPEQHAGGDSVVRFEIEPHDLGARLILTHVFHKGGDLADFASGWHWHLDALDRALEGEAVAFDRARWQALRGVYAATL
jgi:uncharacterized protein YndB with AHSA1/START domain